MTLTMIALWVMNSDSKRSLFKYSGIRRSPDISEFKLKLIKFQSSVHKPNSRNSKEIQKLTSSKNNRKENRQPKEQQGNS